MNCSPFVIQYAILSNKWGAVHAEGAFVYAFFTLIF